MMTQIRQCGRVPYAPLRRGRKISDWRLGSGLVFLEGPEEEDDDYEGDDEVDDGWDDDDDDDWDYDEEDDWEDDDWEDDDEDWDEDE